MHFIQFDETKLKRNYKGIQIDIVTSPLEAFKSIHEFFEHAVNCLDQEIYPEYGVITDYSGAILKTGEYRDILKSRIEAIDADLSFNINDIESLYRIKRSPSDPFSEEYILTTKNEFIMFMWYITE